MDVIGNNCKWEGLDLVLAKEELTHLYQGLIYNFLYNNDINSIHILLNLYDVEIHMTNLYPKYRCIKEIKKRIKRTLFPRINRQLVSNNVSMLIHEDIDRLELTLYLIGYKDGYYEKKWVNPLEDIAIKYYSLERLYGRKFLFHYNTSCKEVQRLMREIYHEIDIREENTNRINDFVTKYCERVVKKKIHNLNSYIDKQLTIEYSTKKLNIKEEEAILSVKELNRIYNTILNTVKRNMLNVYKEAYWFGINDRVLNRYS